MVCRVCNLGHILKPFLHHAGLENIWCLEFNFGTVGARGGYTNDLYYFIYLDEMIALMTSFIIFLFLPIIFYFR